jgi:hypothetical protein
VETDETPSELELGLNNKRKENIVRLMRENRPLYNKLDILMKFLFKALVDHAHLENVKAEMIRGGVLSMDCLKKELREEFKANKACEDIVAKVSEYLTSSEQDDNKLEDKFELLLEFSLYYPHAI